MTGTAAIMNGEVVQAGDPAGQTRVILDTTEGALSEAVASLCGVVRTCVNGMVQVAALTDLLHLLEIGADAMLGS